MMTVRENDYTGLFLLASHFSRQHFYKKRYLVLTIPVPPTPGVDITSPLPLAANVLIASKGTESLGSSRMRVICALFDFFSICGRVGQTSSLAGPCSARRY